MPPGTFSVISHLREQTRFSGGGGGVVPDIFPVPADQYHSLSSGKCFLHFRGTWSSPAIYGHSRKFRETCTHSKNVTTSIHCRNKHLPKVWRGHGPRGPPWLRHCLGHTICMPTGNKVCPPLMSCIVLAFPIMWGLHTCTNSDG